MKTKTGSATSSSDTCLFQFICRGVQYNAYYLCANESLRPRTGQMSEGFVIAEKEKTGTLLPKSLRYVGKVKPTAPVELRPLLQAVNTLVISTTQ